jgi:predicted Zn-dependent protease
MSRTRIQKARARAKQSQPTTAGATPTIADYKALWNVRQRAIIEAWACEKEKRMRFLEKTQPELYRKAQEYINARGGTS